MSGAARDMLAVGLFGKLPTHGDFLQRDLPDDFVSPWDGWLQRVIVGSRNQLGEQWLPAYLSAPIWRFALPADLAGGFVWAGILMPSVDRVGRYFPLTIAGRWLGDISVFHLAAAAGEWLEGLESIALECLDASALDMNRVMTRIRALPGPAAPLRREAGTGWEGHCDIPGQLSSAWIDQLETAAVSELSVPSLWWTAGSEGAASRWMALRAWPDAAAFARMLGTVAESNAPAPACPDPPVKRAAPAIPDTREQVRSAGVTGAGKVRTTNQDAWLDRGDVGCWAVADGMGGHHDGERASRTVVDVLSSEVRGSASVGPLSVMVRSAIDRANELLRQDVDDDDQYAAGSTVVALGLCGREGAVLWVGDSRLYLWRAGALVQLTDDHVGEGNAAHEITRAVGGAASVEVDEKRFEVLPGDRLLLCSDGVHGAIAREAIATLMEMGGEPLVTAQAIEKAVLAGRATDNYTIVVIFKG